MLPSKRNFMPAPFISFFILRESLYSMYCHISRFRQGLRIMMSTSNQIDLSERRPRREGAVRSSSPSPGPGRAPKDQRCAGKGRSPVPCPCQNHRVKFVGGPRVGGLGTAMQRGGEEMGRDGVVGLSSDWTKPEVRVCGIGV